MLTLLRAGLLALACFAAPGLTWPAQAQTCRPLEALLSEAAALAAEGFRMEILTGAAAARGFAALAAAVGEPPRRVSVSSMILLIGPQVAVVVLGEGTQACFQLALTPETAERIAAAALGDPA